MRLIDFLLIENIADFEPKAKNDIKRHLKKIEVLNPNTLEQFTKFFNSLYHKEKIRLLISDIGQIEYDFWMNGLVDIALPKDSKFNYDINSTFWKSIIRKIAKSREKVNHIKNLEDFQWVRHIPIRNYLYNNMETMAYDAHIELEDEKFSYTKSLWYDMFGNSEEYQQFTQLMRKYKDGKIPPSSRRIG